MQIIVLGMHRSGTSLTTRIINMMGAYFGPEGSSLGFAEDNPKGFWERRDILKLNQALFKHFGCTWFKVDGWDDMKLDTVPAPVIHGIRSLVLEMDAHRPWVMKDPRLCMTFPCWKFFLEVPVAVIAWRDPLEIARSLEIRNELPIEYSLALWEYHAVHIIRHAANIPKVFTQHAPMIKNPIAATKELFQALVAQGVQGLRLPSEREILAFVEPDLHRAHKADVKHTLTDYQQKLSSMLRGESPFDAKAEVSPHARGIMQGAKNAAFLRRVS